jgi:branched-subunit amino acid transport protein
MSHGIPIVVYILASALATLIVRLIPFFGKRLGATTPFLYRCMHLLPVAAIGALVFPGAITDFQARWYAGLLGVLAAFLVGMKKLPMIASIAISIVVTYLVLVA